MPRRQAFDPSPYESAPWLAPGPQPRLVETRRADGFEVSSPPETKDARHTATHAFEKPATIYAVMPHTRFRGKWMRYELLLPDRKKETLLHVSRFDFNGQLGYAFAEPRHVPAGAWLLVTGAFDTSPREPCQP